MSPELDDELSALSAIYGLDVLAPQHADTADASDTFVFTTPPELGHQLQIRVRIPPDYPASVKPTVLDGGRGVELVRETLETVWREGEVCFYDLVEALREVLEDDDDNDDDAHEPAPEPEAGAVRAPTPVEETTPQPETSPPSPPQPRARSPSPAPPMNPWIIAAPILEKKSVFLAHALRITTAAEAQNAIKNLLLDKKLKKATHNISAYRIARPNGTTVQDNDDDGETAAGSRLAHLLQVMDVTDVVVVVSRWFGGVKLGPDRFRLINMAAREALVLGGWVEDKEKARERKENEKKEEKEKKAKGKKGKK